MKTLRQHRINFPGDWNLWLLINLTMFSGIAAWLYHGFSAVETALMQSLSLCLRILPLVFFGIVISAYLQVLLHQQQWRHMRDITGSRRYFLAITAGILTPGGPFAAVPVIASLLSAGVQFEICVTYFSAWSLLGIHRMIVWESGILGWSFSISRFLICLPLPLIAGWWAQRLNKEFLH